VDQIIEYIRNNKQRFIDELIEFLKIPSLSAQSRHKADCERAADFVRKQFSQLGLDAQLHPTAGNPIVTARHTSPENKTTVLIYGHYDVQPPEPLDLWTSPPFEPRIEGDNIIARGATDDKGQLFTHIKAVEAHLKTNARLPVNLIFVIEGEEEVAGVHVSEFIRTHRDDLKCDVAVVSDSSQYAPNMPALCYGLRGICAQEIRVQGPKQDLHSGSFGGAVANPVNVLCQMIAQLKDESGKIRIPGFYDDVLPLEQWEREAFAALPWDDEAFRQSLGVKALHGEETYTSIERKWARPTLDVNGIFGGYNGEGAKTIIPAWGGAKITMRLVPNQNPQTISRLFRDFIRKITPPTVEVSFIDHSSCGPVIVKRSAPFVAEALESLRRGFGAEPVFIREGGSIPIVLTIQQELNVHALLLGFGLPDDNAHGPNEKLSLTDFERGIRTSATFFHLCAQK
jgi:acetylornithine deacetylase/succinyl-diaminopimelate desuccinylase-like protein